MRKSQGVGNGFDFAQEVAPAVAHVPHYLYKKGADKHISPADPGLE